MGWNYPEKQCQNQSLHVDALTSHQRLCGQSATSSGPAGTGIQRQPFLYGVIEIVHVRVQVEWVATDFGIPVIDPVIGVFAPLKGP